MKLGSWTNSNVLNSIMISLFLSLIRNTLFGQIWSKKIKLPVSDEIWHFDSYGCAEFYGDVLVLSFELEITFLGKFGLTRQKFVIKIKLGAYNNSNMLNLVIMFICPVLYRKYNFWENLIQKNKMAYFLPRFVTFAECSDYKESCFNVIYIWKIFVKYFCFTS